MREYLTRAGIIGKTNSTNVTFGDNRQNGLSKDLLGETFNGTWTVRIIFFFDEGFLFFSSHLALIQDSPQLRRAERSARVARAISTR